jgi:putative hydrolase
MDAVDALNEIAYRLERELAPSFKIKAFRTAAAALEGIGAEELRERRDDGRLKATKGIGGRSFEVASQALDGDVPAYLEDLRRRGGPLADGGAAILSATRGDLHAHSAWSDGTTSIELMVSAARALGREYLALTDHSPNLTVARGLTAERLAEQLAVIAALNDSIRAERSGSAEFRLLSGIEVDILEDGSLDQTPELLDRLDIIVASVHSKLRSDEEAMTSRMLAAIHNPHVNVLGHCTGRLVEGSRGTRPPSEFDAERVFAACASADVAVEINSRPERQDPPDDLIRLALDEGCLFSIDTDAHAPGQLEFSAYGAERAERMGVPAERIVTTWPLARLTEWAKGKR